MNPIAYIASETSEFISLTQPVDEARKQKAEDTLKTLRFSLSEKMGRTPGALQAWLDGRLPDFSPEELEILVNELFALRQSDPQVNRHSNLFVPNNLYAFLQAAGHPAPDHVITTLAFKWMNQEGNKSRLDVEQSYPKPYIVRESVTNEIYRHLVEANAPRRPLVLLGAKGTGKTGIAAGLCKDAYLWRTYCDGIVWINKDDYKDIGLLKGCLELILDSREIISSKEFSDAGIFAKCVGSRRLLFIFDNVTDANLVQQFMRIPQPSWAGVIVTTYKVEVASALERSTAATLPASTITIPPLTNDEMVRLLGKIIDPITSYEQDSLHLYPNHSLLKSLTAELKDWLILGRMVGEYIRGQIVMGVPLQSAINIIREVLTSDESKSHNAIFQNDLNKVIGENLRTLGQDIKECFLSLTIFPVGTDITFAAIRRLWQVALQISDAGQITQTLTRIHQAGLFTVYDPVAEICRFHDLVFDYLQKETKLERSQFLHRAYLCGTGNVVFDWRQLPDDEPYLWQSLSHHLKMAGWTHHLSDILKDWHYLTRLIWETNAFVAHVDLANAWQQNRKDKLLQALKVGIGRVCHLLNRCESLQEIWQVLYQRFLFTPALKTHLDKMLPNITFPCVLPRFSLDDIQPNVVFTVEQYTSFIQDVVFSPSGAWFATASRAPHNKENTIRIWDSETGKLLGELSGHSRAIFKLAAFPGDRTLASVSADGTARLWNISTSECLLVIPAPVRQDRNLYFRSIAVSSDGQQLIAGANNGSLFACDVETGAIAELGSAHDHPILDLAYSSNGKFFVAASSDQTVSIWNAQTREKRISLSGKSGAVTGICISPDNLTIGSVATDGTIRLWDPQTGQLIRILGRSSRPLLGINISPNGQYISAVGMDEDVCLWNVKTGRKKVLGKHTNYIYATAFSPLNGNYLVSASGDGAAHMWNASTPERIKTQKNNHTNWVRSVAFNPDGSRLVSAAEDGTFKSWDSETGMVLRSSKQIDARPSYAAFTADGQYVITSALDGGIRIFDAETMDVPIFQLNLKGDVRRLALTKRWVAAGSKEGTIKVWDLKSQHEIVTLMGHKRYVTAIAFSPDNHYLVTSSYDNQLVCWDTETWKPLQYLLTESSTVYSLAYSPDGQWLASGTLSGNVSLWHRNATRFEKVFELMISPIAQAPISGLSFSADSRWLATACLDEMLKIWDVQTSVHLATFQLDAMPFDCAFHPTIENRISAASELGIVWFDIRTS